MSEHGPDWQTAATRLAEKVAADAPEWTEAVCVTPRHELVPRWWERLPNSPTEEWELIAPEAGSTAGIESAYSDKTLVTRVGPKHADHAQRATRPRVALRRRQRCRV